VNEARLSVPEFWSNVSTHSEVWILINGAGDKARYIGNLFEIRTENMRKGSSKSRGGLD
jgi:hypothetical protein